MKTDQPTTGVSRRHFLILSRDAAFGVGAALAVPGVVFAAGSEGALARMTHLDRTLLRMARDIYPHDGLPDRYYHYHEPVQGLLAEQRELLTAGIDALDAEARVRHGRSYIHVVAEPSRVELLRDIEQTPFFQAVRTALLFGIYDNKALWQPLFGYEGSSWQKGGYINRGFNDLDWL